MCGIAGFIDLWDQRGVRGQDERAEILRRMCEVIRYRGPDDSGAMLQDGVALGMRRLSIIDLAGGHQPISGEDGSATVIFNGEIYNFQELQPKLEAHGHKFQTRSDTEAIVHAYEQYGTSCVDHLRGMFAFAIWDEKKKSLMIARDRAGEKPLYYTLTNGKTLVFGSELKSLLEHPDVQRVTSAESLDAYFSLGYVPDPLSIFKNIKKLPPGHLLTFANGNLHIRQYWDFSYENNGSRRTENDYIEELRELLDEAVRIRLVSDVPLGAFLSGGVDSSTVVALMARHMTQPVKTFSIGFLEDSYSELKYARQAAKKFGTDHHEFFVTPEICDVVDELAWHFDEPFADSSAIPTYVVSKLAREHVTVVLSGDGGDELFAGYTRYVTERKRRKYGLLPRRFRQGLMEPLSRTLPHGAWGRNFLHNVALDPIDRYFDNVSIFTGLNKRSLYTPDFYHSLGNTSQIGMTFQEYGDNVSTNALLDALLYIDSKTYLPGDILTKVDRMSMAVSLEARVPLLDHKLIDFVTRIPASMKMSGLETKHLFKRAVADIVPEEILARPKQGFGVPIQQWINQQLRERIRDTLTDSRFRQRGIISHAYTDVLLDEHERGRRDHSMALWSLLMLELWHRAFVDGDQRQAHSGEFVIDTSAQSLAERNHIQQWEKEEISRSAIESAYTLKGQLRYSDSEINRFLQARADTIYPLEYSHYLLGDVAGKTVLDFGCGAGKSSVLLARRNAKVIAMDISEPIMKVAKERLVKNEIFNSVSFINASAHNIPLADESVDLVFGIAILHHLHLQLVSREVYRILKKGGRAIFQEPVRNSKVIKLLRGLIPYQAEDVSPFERPLTDEELSDFGGEFSQYRSKAFTLPYINLAGILPVANKFINPLQRFDGAVLRKFPSLDYYATVRVIEMVK
ncbi:MAG TPA: asparagine synthase (glutamine-hydrolyzing) [Pyrinomonadaceae bacterium]|nr:asparagine synthase (glutamine-hydrolyzing) [Pyrinomonadaceae bacterium]